MKGNLNKRPINMARWFIEHNSTTRGTAEHFGVSKSTVHRDFTVRLRALDIALYEAVSAQLERNKQERTIRGGIATQKKWRLSR